MKITFYYSNSIIDCYHLCAKIVLGNSMQHEGMQVKKSLLILEDEEIKTKIDKEMWTFSQNFFIPHFTFEDLDNLANKSLSSEEILFIKDNNPMILCDYSFFTKNFKKNLEKFHFNDFVFLLESTTFIAMRSFLLEFIAQNTDKDFIFFCLKQNPEKQKEEVKQFCANLNINTEDIRFFIKEDKWNKIDLK